MCFINVGFLNNSQKSVKLRLFVAFSWPLLEVVLIFAASID